MSARHPDTDRLIHTCARCGDTLNPDGEPVEQNAVYYVEADEERNPYTVDAAVALRHTPETAPLRDALVNEKGLSTEAANNALARDDANLLSFEGGLPNSVTPPAAVDTREETQQELDSEGNVINEWTVTIERPHAPDDAFDRDVGVDPEVAKHDDDVAAVRTERIEVDRPAMLLVCPDCKREGDRVEWSGRGVVED